MCKTPQLALRLRRGNRFGTINGEAPDGVPLSNLPGLHACTLVRHTARPTIASFKVRVP
jgi:hypothetical protein